MKKLSVIFFAALLIYSCNDTTEIKGFVISGTVSNAEGKEILLSKLISKKSIAVDTVKLDKEGKFFFNAEAESPEFYTLSLSKERKKILLIADSLTNVKIEIDGSNFYKSYTIEGSKDNKLLKLLNSKYEKTLIEIDSLKKIYRSDTMDIKNDSVKTSLDKKLGELTNKHRTFLIDFINKNSSSLASLWALTHSLAPNKPFLKTDKHLSSYKKIDRALYKLHPNSAAVKFLHDYLQKMKTEGAFETGTNIGDTAPEISLPTPEGPKKTLSSLKGNYVLLDFWASWCGPCRKENPNLVYNYYKYRGKGFIIFQVSLDRSKEKWVQAIKKDKLGEWHHVSDLLFWNSAAAKKYKVDGIPTNFLIDTEGKIISVNLKGNRLGKKLFEIYKY